MSTLLGRPEEPWPLARAVDALNESAARGGVPGLVWLAGIVYPSLAISLDLARSLIGALERMAAVDLPGGGVDLGAMVGVVGNLRVQAKDEPLVTLLLLLVPLLFLYRLVAGLARLSDPELWESRAAERPGFAKVVIGVGQRLDLPENRRTVRLRDVWRAGAGLGAGALGLWLVLLALLCTATVLLLGVPVMFAKLLGSGFVLQLLVVLLLPVLLVLLAYALLLQVANQLALHSLAHNRRGVASALAHAWRLMQSAPASVARAALLDGVLVVAVAVLVQLTNGLFGTSVPLLSEFLLLALLGFAGVTRASFWARAYRALGGLSTAREAPATARASAAV